MKTKNIKIKLYGLINEGTFNCIIVEKHKYFLEWLETFLDTQHLKEHIRVDKIKRVYVIKNDINKYIDVHHGCGSTYGKVNIFYGKKRVFIVINCSSKIRKKFIKKLTETTKWCKAKRIKSDRIVKRFK